MTPSCLDMFYWGKTLLVFAMVTSFISGYGEGAQDSNKWPGTPWRVAEITLHVATIFVIRRTKFAGNTLLPFNETEFSCHQSNSKVTTSLGRGKTKSKDHGYSLWWAASVCGAVKLAESQFRQSTLVSLVLVRSGCVNFLHPCLAHVVR